MMRLGRRDTEQMPTQTRLAEPARHRRSQDAAAEPAAPGDHQHAAMTGRLGGSDKARERTVRLALRQPMQVQPGLDLMTAALQSLGIGAIDAGEAVERRPGPG